MVPSIQFCYSGVYDRRCRAVFEKHFPDQKYPSQNTVLKFISSLEREWELNGKRYLQAISKIAKLSWKENDIIVYVVGGTRPFSDPLTIRYRSSKNEALDTLTHELVHRVFIGHTHSHSVFRYFKKYNKSFSDVTAVHIPILAIHAVFLKQLFGTRRLHAEIARAHRGDYKIAWEFVMQRGPEEVVKELISRYSK